MNKRDLLAFYLSGTNCHKTCTRPPSCQLLENRLYILFSECTFDMDYGTFKKTLPCQAHETRAYLKYKLCFILKSQNNKSYISSKKQFIRQSFFVRCFQIISVISMFLKLCKEVLSLRYARERNNSKDWFHNSVSKNK